MFAIKEKKINRIFNKKGFVSIEAVFALTSVLLVILLAIGFFVFMFPRIALQPEVHQLSQRAKINGGLTDGFENSDIDTFKKRLEEKGYNINEVEVLATADSDGRDVTGITPRGEDGDFYVKRGSGETIDITVIIPSNVKLLENILGVMGGSSKLPQKYTFSESVMSERW